MDDVRGPLARIPSPRIRWSDMTLGTDAQITARAAYQASGVDPWRRAATALPARYARRSAVRTKA